MASSSSASFSHSYLVLCRATTGLHLLPWQAKASTQRGEEGIWQLLREVHPLGRPLEQLQALSLKSRCRLHSKVSEFEPESSFWVDDKFSECFLCFVIWAAVMRLSKPIMQFQPPVLVEPDDLPYPLARLALPSKPNPHAINTLARFSSQWAWQTFILVCKCICLYRTRTPRSTQDFYRNVIPFISGRERICPQCTCQMYRTHLVLALHSLFRVLLGITYLGIADTVNLNLTSISNIYVGEVFSSYISLYNHTQSEIYNVSIKVYFTLHFFAIPVWMS